MSLTFAAESVTAVLGPNGVGKTTILNLILGLIRPESGQILIFGKPMDRHPPRQLRRFIGMVPQNETVPFDLSLMEYVLLGRAPYLPLLRLPGKRDLEIADAVIENMGLGHMKTRSVPSLSSGERQLTAIARALTQTPDILLFDEPTAHLDLPNARHIIRLMKAISQDEGRTVIFTTHDPNAAAAVADQVILLGADGPVAKGPAQSVFIPEHLAAAYGEAVEVIQTRHGVFVKAW